MKTLKIILITAFLSLLFSACSSKVQTDVIESKTEDISKLLNDLIKKEKEIAELTQKLEDCQNQK